MRFKDMQLQMHEISKLKGFHDKTPVARLVFNRTDMVSRWLMLGVTELSEAMEALREGNKENFAEELGDVVIRVMDTAQAMGIDLEAEILKKAAKNRMRPKMHGKKC